jgi:hypothetical protein
VYLWRHAPEVPFPPLKLELEGSQATSPAAAITGSEAACAIPLVPAGLTGPADNQTNAIIVASENKDPRRLNCMDFIEPSLWLWCMSRNKKPRLT